MPTPWVQYGVTVGCVKCVAFWRESIRKCASVLEIKAKAPFVKLKIWMELLFSLFLWCVIIMMIMRQLNWTASGHYPCFLFELKCWMKPRNRQWTVWLSFWEHCFWSTDIIGHCCLCFIISSLRVELILIQWWQLFAGVRQKRKKYRVKTKRQLNFKGEIGRIVVIYANISFLCCPSQLSSSLSSAHKPILERDLWLYTIPPLRNL